jgi:DNA polymerase III delta' subunit
MRLSEVIGQSGLARLMARLIARRRLPPALLLEGVPGCGRRTLALAIAQAVLCARAQDGDACGECSSCRMVVEGNHPDLVSLPHDTQGDDVGVELVRTAIAEAAYQSPLIAAGRVFILHGVERLNHAASNTLLKVLEEPPHGTHLIMTTANAGAVLRTIRSRTQLHRLAPLSTADLERVLMLLGVSAEEARRRAPGGAGSHRGAHDGDVAPPLAAMVRLCREGLDPALVAEVVAGLPQAQREDGEMTLAAEQRRVLGTWLRALLHELRPGLRTERALGDADAIERVMQLQRDVHLNISPQLVVEGLALGIR